MKLQSLAVNGECECYEAVFSDGELTVTKRIQRYACGGKFELSMRHEFMKKAREADRDFAYMKHGANWRDHVQYTQNFWDGLTEDQLKALV